MRFSSPRYWLGALLHLRMRHFQVARSDAISEFKRSHSFLHCLSAYPYIFKTFLLRSWLDRFVLDVIHHEVYQVTRTCEFSDEWWKSWPNQRRLWRHWKGIMFGYNPVILSAWRTGQIYPRCEGSKANNFLISSVIKLIKQM